MSETGAVARAELFDMHFHLGFCADPAASARALARAGAGGLTCSVTLEDFARQQRALAGSADLRAAAGLHPWWVERGEGASPRLEALVAHVGRERFVGEVGLDFAPRRAATRDAQLDVLRAVARACACAGDKVLSIHAVRAAGTVLDVLEAAGTLSGDAGCACIFHRFSGSSDELVRARRAGCLFSVHPCMLASSRGRAYVRQVPADRLLLETDAPAAEGAPFDAAEQRAALEYLVASIARERGEDAGELAGRIACTSRALLGIDAC